MFKKIFDGILIGFGIFLFFGIIFGIVTAVGFHTADEIVSGSFNGNFDFSSATITGLDIVNTTYVLGEVNTGKKWINGKPIYRNIYEGTISNTATNGNIQIASTETVEDIVIWGGSIYTTTGWVGGLPYNNPSYQSYLLKSSNTNLIECWFTGSNYDVQWRGRPVKIWVEYTKTID